LGLYASEDTAIKEVPQFRCIGIGKELAKYVLSRDGVLGSDRMSLQTAETLALRVLEHVKESVSGCGKETDVLILGSGGVLTRKNQHDYYFELKTIELYDQMTSVLLPFSLELDMPAREREVGFWIALNSYFDRLKMLQLEKQQREEEDREES
jgi:predicted ribosome quality control (RQC) complex YloA/Tae2 family protein